MPKATRKKKEKQADFVKAKLKLGKGKKQASNTTDTSFKARSIALPGQEALNRALQISEGAGPSEPTTANGLTLEDIFIRLRHPNSVVRKEALGGLREILQVDVSREVGKVLRALGGLVADDDVAVRKGLLGLLDWYLAHLSQSVLSPHLPLLVLQASSALSHIFPEIRLDACKLVHLMLQYVPNHVVSSWPYESSNILEGLRLAVGLGGEKGVHSQIGRLTGGAKLVTMKAMREFVRIGLENGMAQKWGERYLEERQSSRGKFEVVKEESGLENVQLEGWLVSARISKLEGDGDAWELGRLGSSGGKGDEEGVVSVLSQLYIQLHPLLLSTFLENAPTAFSSSAASFTPTSEDISLALCVMTASLTELLADAILTRATPDANTPELRQVKSCISDFHRRMTGWFPFNSRTTQTPSGVTPGFELSLAYARLAVLLAPRPVDLKFTKHSTKRGKEVGWRERVKATEEAWKTMREAKGKGKIGQNQWAMEEVADWVVEVLAPKKDVLAPSLTPEAYSALLPIVWALLAQPPSCLPSNDADIPSHVGSAFIAHLIRQGSSSPIRDIGEEFLIALILVHEKKYPILPFYIVPQSPLRSMIKGWFEGIPKTLFELGIKNESASERLLRFLLIVGSRGEGAYEQPYSLIDPTTFPSLTPKLAPFWHLQHPSKGSIPGAWTKFNNGEVKRLGLDVAMVWKQWNGVRLSDAIGRVCGHDQWGAYWRR
ncbi:pre-rRNA-processing protein IPI1 [Cryptococcus neoformans Bt1]|nr:pre-rRNA-processing protein IPI1 [Cryptococcus neoformans var. grubii Bt1]